MAYRLLALDIDGTLTNSDKKITPRTAKALIEAQKMGTDLVLASGRPPCGIEPLALQLQMPRYRGFILAFNGGRVIDCESGRVIYRKNLSPETVALVYDLAREFGANIVVHINKTLVTPNTDDEYVRLEARVNNMDVFRADDFNRAVNCPVPKCLLTGDGEHLAGVEVKLKERLGGNFSVVRSEPFFLEVMPKNVDKAHSLEMLLNRLKISKFETIACGDGFNDRSMVSFAGLGVAMANAQPPVKAAAKYVTLSNDEDGIALVVENFILEKRESMNV